MDKGRHVWFDAGGEYLLYGIVIASKGDRLSVKAEEDGKVYTVDEEKTRPVAEVDPPDGVEDMIQLSDLHQGSLLRNIKKRFKAKLIYTYTGSILVAVNPYKLFDIYNLNVVRKYEGQLIGKLPPHIFAIGSAAFSNMIKTREDQCVVISGESGAGKTESTKLIMQYLAAVNKSPSNLTTEQILEANPLLESFGNAKTVRNDNSSRFGKYLEINFGRRGVINGARTTEYLLEKSRIVYQAGGERNYHVFYEMLVGLAPNDKLKYGLLKAENYFYLNQGGACCLEGKDDVNDFLRLVASTEVLGFSHEEKDAIFRILATVLHLGNLCFSMEVRSGQDASVVDSENELQAVSALLMVPSDSFRLSLTHKLTETRGERFRTPLNIERALDTRDALAKALYSKLFSWLVQRVNSIIDRQKKVTSIAVLDIFGFEDFKTNSFEQLCINYANENLQYYFNQHIFKLEQEEYSREQISWETIEFNDNQPCLDLIARKPLGILHILDDESNFPKATDQSFLDKLLQQHEKNSYFEKPKTKKPLFAIHHYAGSVWYTVSMFLDKNRDILRPDLIELLNSSTSPFISSLFAEDYEVVMSSGARKKKTPTVAAKFHQSLTDLISAMQQCHPFFVRCIKPNAEKASMTFENKLVLDQLRYSGMLETIRIRRAGFPVRLKFSAFAKRYQCLAEGLPVNSGDRATCIHVIEKLKDKIGSAHQLGLTKVFLREVAEQKLEEARAIRLRGAAVLIQKHVRGYLARMRYIKLRQAVIVIQRYVATWLARTHFLQMRQNVILVQSYVRMHQQQQRYILIRDAHRREQEELRRIQEEERARRKAMEESSRLIDDHHFSSDQWVPMMDVTSLEIPTELALILDSIARGWRHQHIERGLIAVRDQYETDSFSAAELPGDVDSHAFSKFTGAHFQEGYSWEFQRQPLTQPLTKLCSEKLQLEAVAVFKMIMRFIGDPAVSGSQEVAIGNYIIQKGIMYPELRDEIYSQLACQTYSNNEESSESERGWLLFALCLCAFPPSPLLYKYLLNYVSGCGESGYNGFCQRRLLRCVVSLSGISRCHPPCMLEWKACRSFSTMVLPFVFSDDVKLWAVVDSWTTAEEMATCLLRQRGIEVGHSGWTIALLEEKERHELSGCDFVLDLLSELELPPDFPSSPSPGFSTRAFGSLGPGTRHMASSRVDSPIMGHRSYRSRQAFGSSHNENRGQMEQLMAGRRKRPALHLHQQFSPMTSAPPPVLQPVDRDMNKERKRSVTDFLDSLFEPVLSGSMEDLTNPTSLQAKLKGRGGMPPPPPPRSSKRPPGAVPLLPPTTEGQQIVTGAVASMAAAFAQRHHMKRDDASSVVSEPMSNFARQLATRKAALAAKGTMESSSAAEPASEFQKQLLAKRNFLSQPGTGDHFHHHVDSSQNILYSPLANDEIMLSIPPHPSFAPPPLPDGESSVSPPLFGDPFAPSQHLHSSEYNLANALDGAAASVSGIDSGLKRTKPVRLLKMIQGPAVTYNRPTWNVSVRKEMFAANEKLENPLILNLIFAQIVRDTYSTTCCRISKDERLKMKDLLRRYGVTVGNLSQSAAVKKIVVETARGWPSYFTKLFPVVGVESAVRHVTHIGVSHTGVKLIQLHGLELKTIESYVYSEVTDYYANDFTFQLIVNEISISFRTNRAGEIGQLIEAQMIALEQNAKFVLAVEDYETRESTLLSFKKGAVIKLKQKEGVDAGWLFGMYEGQTGSFPNEYVIPIVGAPTESAIEQAKRNARKKQLSQTKLATEPVRVASGIERHKTSFKAKKGRDLTMLGQGKATQAASPNSSPSMERLHPGNDLMTGKYSMMEFAKEHFRNAHDKYEMQRKADGSIRGTLKIVGTIRATFGKTMRQRKESWSWSPLADLVKFTKSPIQASMLPLPPQLNKLALECFIAIMRFMGDYMMKGKSVTDLVYFILKTMRQHDDLRDEIYCQLIKQTTNNKSTRPDSCARGWRLLSICCAYIQCSELFRPFLEKYVKTAARDPQREFHATAAICLQNLNKTFKIGGRKNPPSQAEVEAVAAGRFTKRQMFYLPGNMTKVLKIKTSTTAKDVVREVCGMMGLITDEEVDEYGLFADLGKESMPVPFNPHDYIMDFTNALEKQELEFWLYFKKIIWYRPITLDNELMVDLLYHQAKPDFMRASLIVQKDNELTPAIQNEVAMLSALIHRASDARTMPSIAEAEYLIPATLANKSTPQMWVKLIQEHFDSVRDMAPVEARAYFVDIIQQWPLYGCRFFPVKDVSDQRVKGETLLAINKKGVHFLKSSTREMVISYPFSEIVSTRRLKAHSGRQYLDMKCGNLMVHRVTRLETLYGHDISQLITLYVECQLKDRQRQEEAAGVVRVNAIDI